MSSAAGPARLLLVAAAASEGRAILRGLGAGAASLASWRLHAVEPSVDLLLTGVGKAAAAGALARCLDADRHAAVVNLGVAGALPNATGAGFAAELLDVVLASPSLLADEGLASPAGFQSLADMGFSPAGGADGAPAGNAQAAADARAGMGAMPDPRLAAALAPLADRTGPVATVSTCSGVDARARELARRSAAVAEAMEGASLAFTIRCLIDSDRAPASLAFAELRVISNTTGDRSEQRWRLGEALDRLAELAPHVRERALAVVAPDGAGG